MRIGIDASRALRGERTGTEQYSVEIIRHLCTQPESRQHEWLLYTDVEPGPELQQRLTHGRRVTWRRLPAARMWSHRRLGSAVRADDLDVFFVPSHVVPFWVGPRRFPPTVVTIHDLGYRHFPSAHTRRQRHYLDASTRWSLHAATAVICVSRATADDVMRIYSTPADRLHVVYEAPTLERRPDAAGAAVPPAAGGGSHGLYVGTIQPRKNLERVIAAFDRISARVEWDLLLVGKPGWKSAPIFARAAASASAARIHLPGYLPAEALAEHYQRARFFCFPSLFEGFGLPVLDAQLQGVPVLTSNNSSLPEIAGDAAILVDPTDVDAIADAMLRLSRDEELRRRLIAAGYENVKRFSWEKAAAETMAVLTQAAAEGK